MAPLQREIIRWYLGNSLSYRVMEEIMREWGLLVDQTTIYQWVPAYALELAKQCWRHLKPTTDAVNHVGSSYHISRTRSSLLETRLSG